jgi:fructose-1,6-bisphosphatase
VTTNKFKIPNKRSEKYSTGGLDRIQKLEDSIQIGVFKFEDSVIDNYKDINPFCFQLKLINTFPF